MLLGPCPETDEERARTSCPPRGPRGVSAIGRELFGQLAKPPLTRQRHLQTAVVGGKGAENDPLRAEHPSKHPTLAGKGRSCDISGPQGASQAVLAALCGRAGRAGELTSGYGIGMTIFAIVFLPAASLTDRCPRSPALVLAASV